MLTEVLVTYAVIYVASITVYGLTGGILSWVNARNPERRIQPARRGEKRMRQEIMASLGALAMSAALLTAGYLAQRWGWTWQPVELSWWSFPLFFVVGMVILDAWFYLGHRLLHWGPLYKYHALHHKSVAPTAWSNDSSTLIDTAIEHAFYLFVWFLLPVPAASVFALRLFDQISGMIGHSGFEYFASPSSRFPSPFICTTFHDLHHSQFRYNYGNMFSIWDRLLGTVHPDYDRMVERMEDGETPGKAAARS
ncbi:MAG: sterol desaturase family protein [Pseudomonadota bacterium]